MNATDLGQLGRSFSIAEPDYIDTIKAMLARKQASGEIDAMHRDLREQGKAYVRRPPGAVLPRATQHRAFAIDPTYRVPADIKDATGRVLYPMGFAFNPLTVKPLTRTVCFIDGDDPEQVAWLETYCGNAVAFKRVLVNGDYVAISQKASARIYFDQHGVLTKHFRIEAVPAVVRQSGGLLYVEEFNI